MDLSDSPRRRRAGAVAAGLAVIWASLLASPTWAVMQVDVVVNILPDSGFDEARVRSVVDEANKILRQQLDVELNPASIQQLPLPLPNGVLDKEQVTARTDAILEQVARQEIVDDTANDKGFKIYLARRIDTRRGQGAEGGFSAVGGKYAWLARDAQDPLGQVGPRTNAQIGGTLAHEIGHLGGLGGGHQIDGDTSATGEGHAPDQPGNDGRDNLMADGRSRRGTALTDAQKQLMLRNLPFSGKGAFHMTPFTPGQREPQQFGTAFDGVEDEAGVAALDLLAIDLSSAEDAPDLECAVTLAGAFDAVGPLLVGYRLLFDTDANAATGATVDEFTGIEREVLLIVQRVSPGGALLTSGYVIDWPTGQMVSLPTPPEVIARTVLGEPLGPDDDPAAIGPTLHKVGCRIPKSALGFSADEVPVGVLAVDAGGPRDRASLLFDQRRFEKDAALVLFQGTVTPGDTVPFQIARLTPNAPFTVFVNSEPVLSGILGPDGAASGEFPLPANPQPGTFSFVIRARDDTGESAFNSLNNGLPTLRLEINTSEAVTGTLQEIGLLLSNLDTPVQADAYFGALLPAAAGPQFGCPLGDAALFFSEQMAQASIACLSAPVQTFPRLLVNATLPAGLPQTEVPLLAFAWPAGLPAGPYMFFLALAPAGGFTGGSVELIALAAATVDFAGL